MYNQYSGNWPNNRLPERAHFEAPGITAKHVGLHAKILVLDKRLVFVGTINTDPRSMTLNTEVSLNYKTGA